MNSSGTVVCGGLICLASLVVQRLNSDELVVSSVIAPLLTVLLITFLANSAEDSVTAHCIERQLTGVAQNKSFLKPSHI